MKYTSTNPPIECLMKQSTCYQQSYAIQPKGILWHSTGANNPTIRRYVQPDDNAPNRQQLLEIIGTNPNKNDWNHTYHEAGLNGWIGLLADNSVSAVQTLPWKWRPWGCGSGKNGSCNSGWIQFEICEDGLTDPDYFEKIYKEACELTAYLCIEFNIDPLGTVIHNGIKVPTILCHQDSYKYGLGSNHGDVLHWLPKFKRSMSDVRNDVALIIQKHRQGDVLDMTNLELAELVKKTIHEELAKEAVKYHDLDDVPSYFKKDMQTFLDLDIINGGTDRSVNDHDLNISEDQLKSAIIGMRYTDHKFNELKHSINILTNTTNRILSLLDTKN